MAINTISKFITLDVYNHDTTPETIKAIAADNDTRYVAAEIQNEGVWYDIGNNSDVELIILRPDKVGVAITGQPYPIEYQSGGEIDPETGDETPIVTETYYGVYAELDQPALAISGTLLGQFKITNGNQILRTELFKINNGRALDTETSDWAGEYDGYNLDELVADVAEAVAKVDEMETDVSQIKEDFTDKVNSAVIYCDNVEDGYYSSNNGQKFPNTSSSSYKRSVNLIPADEDALYIANRITLCCCYDKNGTFISRITLYPKTATFIRQTTPTGTVFVGLSATNATDFMLTKMTAEDVQGIEYPYESDSYVHIESYWCNGSGNLTSTQNFDLLIIPVKEGEKWYVSNSANYNLLCFDATGTLLTATYESRSPIGKIVTVPAGAKTMCVNLYRARTKGVNTEMSDYVARVDGKKILAIGDSLTWLDGRSGSYGGMSYFSGWQRQLRLAGHDVISAGFSGYPYATGLDVVDGVDYSIYKEIVANAYDVSGYDMVILFGGTNDVLYNGALGDRPTDYSNRTFDASKFNGALGAIISYIRTNNTTARILLASFPKSEAESRVYSNAKSRVDEIEYNADFWSCKYVNIWSDLNVQPTYDGFDQFFYDTTHANFLGMERIGQIMLNAVNAYN